MSSRQLNTASDFIFRLPSDCLQVIRDRILPFIAGCSDTPDEPDVCPPCPVSSVQWPGVASHRAFQLFQLKKSSMKSMFQLFLPADSRGIKSSMKSMFQLLARVCFQVPL
jgi:hypothetical protein